jgi:hypothetical protein
MNVISGAARAARNAVAVLRDAGEGAWSFTSSKRRQRTQTSEEARAGLEVEPQITIKPESEPTPSQVPPAKKAVAESPAKEVASANPTRSETRPTKRGAKAIAERVPSETPPLRKTAAARSETPPAKEGSVKAPAKKAAAKAPSKKAAAKAPAKKAAAKAPSKKAAAKVPVKKAAAEVPA